MKHNQHRSSRRPRSSRSGFTLVEIIVVIIIIGVLAAIIGPRLIGRVGQAKGSAAKANAAAIANAVKMYYADYGSFPPNGDLSVLAVKPANGGNGPYVENAEQLKDPWGRPFILIIPGHKNVDFDVVSYGLDGKPGGTGEDADIVVP